VVGGVDSLESDLEGAITSVSEDESDESELELESESESVLDLDFCSSLKDLLFKILQAFSTTLSKEYTSNSKIDRLQKD